MNSFNIIQKIKIIIHTIIRIKITAIVKIRNKIYHEIIIERQNRN